MLNASSSSEGDLIRSLIIIVLARWKLPMMRLASVGADANYPKQKFGLHAVTLDVGVVNYYCGVDYSTTYKSFQLVEE